MLYDLQELLPLAATWWAVSLSGVMSPGPISAMAISEGARRGALAGPLITAGHAATELVMVGALAVGLSRVLQAPAVVGTIGVLGGLVLVWMGWGIARSAREETLGPAPAAGSPVRTGAGVVRASILMTLGNPYWLLWWTTVGAAYFVAFHRFGPAALVLFFFVGHIALDLSWTSFLAITVGAGRGRLPVAAYRAVLGLCGVFVVGMGGFFLYSGLGLLARR
ncbi:MAG: LysE family transporter [Armatimonadota bacterium]|nr:LysE family transporter [Armatimonadota bacterium]